MEMQTTILILYIIEDSEDILIHFLSGDCWWKKWWHSLCLLTILSKAVNGFQYHMRLTHISFTLKLWLFKSKPCLLSTIAGLINVSVSSAGESGKSGSKPERIPWWGQKKFGWNIAMLSCANCLIQPPADLDWWRMKRGLWNSWNH